MAPKPVVHGLTLTFQLKHIVDLTPQSLFRRTVMRICFYLTKCCHYFALVPELTGAGSLHYHLDIHVKDYVKYSIFLNYWRRNYGFISVTPYYNDGRVSGPAMEFVSESGRSYKILDDVRYNRLRWITYMRKDGPHPLRELSGIKKSCWNMITMTNCRNFLRKMLSKLRKKQERSYLCLVRAEQEEVVQWVGNKYVYISDI